jgi:hypothetical protein
MTLGRGHNRPWVLRNLIYEEIHLERQGGMV